MNIIKPKWHLLESCPCCGQGFPVFVRCISCGLVTVNCEELGDTFLDPRNLDENFTETCPNCKSDCKTFEFATTEEILNAGFNEGDFQ